MHKYILNADGNPVVCDDVLEWSRWYEANDAMRRVAVTEFDGGRVSTVFLGLDHRFTYGVDPVLWETMIFGGPNDGWQDRYTSKEHALAGHTQAVKLATAPPA